MTTGRCGVQRRRERGRRWLAAIGVAGGGADEELERVVDESRDRGVARIAEVCGLGPVMRDNPAVHGVLRGFSGMAEATTREWLRHGRLTRRQVHVLLESALLRIIRDVVPEVLAAGEES